MCMCEYRSKRCYFPSSAFPEHNKTSEREQIRSLLHFFALFLPLTPLCLSPSLPLPSHTLRLALSLPVREGAYIRRYVRNGSVRSLHFPFPPSTPPLSLSLSLVLSRLLLCTSAASPEPWPKNANTTLCSCVAAKGMQTKALP